MKSLLVLLLVILVLVPGAARAQQPQGQPVEVAAGADIVAWQQLEHLRLEGAEAVEAYRAFVSTWSASPLAAAAWGRLVELGAASLDEQEGPEGKRVAAVAARWAELQVALAAVTVEDVEEIDLSEPDDDAAVMRDTGR